MGRPRLTGIGQHAKGALGMKKSAKKLRLHRETLASLGERERGRVFGGILTESCATACYECRPAPSIYDTASWCICE